MIPVLAAALAVVLLAAIRFRMGSLKHPATFVVVWWMTWIFVVSSGMTDLFQPSGTTWMMFLVMVVTFVLGSIWNNRRVEAPNANATVRWWSLRLAAVSGTLMLPLLAYYASQSFELQSELQDDVNVRELAFSSVESGDHIIFGSSALRNLITMSIGAYIGYFTCYAVATIQKKRAVLLLFSAMALTIAYQFIELGRSLTYRMVMVLGIGLILSRIQFSFRRYLSTGFITASIAGIALAYGVLASQGRVGQDFEIRKLVNRFLDYHGAGFVLYDMALDDPSSPLNNDLMFGRATLSAFDTITAFGIRRIYRDYTPYSYINGRYIYEHYPIGMREGRLIYSNAYFTILYPLYLDWRWVGIVCFPFLVGYVNSRLYARWVGGGSELSFALCLFITVNCLMALFLTPTERVGNATAVMLFAFMYWIAKRTRPEPALLPHRARATVPSLPAVEPRGASGLRGRGIYSEV